MADDSSNRSISIPRTEEAIPIDGSPANPSWQRVQLARHPKRPHSRDYIQALITGFEELAWRPLLWR